MKTYFLEINNTKDSAKKLSKDIKVFLEKNGEHVTAFVEESDVIISLGGDGTMLRTWRKYQNLNKPIFGINCGTLGYLTEGTINNWEAKLLSIINNDYSIEERIAIEGNIYKDGKKIYSNIAINDVVLAKVNSLVRMKVFVNNKFLTNFGADGIIVSTPTGSTGYALSSGGSFIAPDSDMMEIVAIAPHTLLNRSIVIGGDCVVKLEVEGRADGMVQFDGNNFDEKLGPGDVVEIKKTNNCMKLIAVDLESFISNISKTFA